MSRPARSLQFRVPKIAESAVERARLAVVPRTRTRAPRFPFLFLVSAIAVAGVVGLLLFNTQMQKAAFGGRQLEAERASLTVRHQELTQELQDLRSYQTIAEKAQRLGMVVPANLPFLNASDGSINGEVVTAAPTDRVDLKQAVGADPYAGLKAAVARKEAQAKAAAQRAAQKKAAKAKAQREAAKRAAQKEKQEQAAQRQNRTSQPATRG